MRPKRARSGAIDLLRIVGIVAVVSGHVWDTEQFRAVIHPWHVPLFFILTGYLWNPSRTLKDEFSTRFRTLAIPYAAWLIIIGGVFWTVLLLTKEFWIGAVVTPIYGGAFAVRPFSAFWFISALFFAALIYRAIFRLPAVAQWVIAAILVTAAYVASDLLALAPLALGSAAASVIFLLIGSSIRRFRHVFTRPYITALLLLASSIALVTTGLSSPVNIKVADFGTPVVSVVVASAISLALILLFETFVPLLGATFSAVVTRIALGGMMVILTHAAVLLLLDTPASGRWLDFVVALVVPWIIAVFILRLRVSPILTGAPQQGRLTHSLK